ncbi:MAG: sel1 repeat family protein [Clostridia bacterium]|nr:sel1 repeat family protein [Clostridia bacterium]
MNLFEFGKRKREAKRGSSSSARLVGYAYLQGDGVKKNEEKARAYLYQAFKGGEDVLADLISLYGNGKGRDDEAKEVFSLAVEQKNAEAMVAMADRFAETNAEKSELYLSAAKLDSKEGALRFISLRLRDESLPSERVLYWAEKYALLGDGAFSYLAGLCHEKGIDAVPSDENAFYWYLKGSEKDNPDCIHALGLLCEQGRGTKQNFDSATFYFSSVKETYPFDYGRILLSRGEEAGIPYLVRVADRNKEASLLLGRYYERFDTRACALYYGKALSDPSAKFRFARYTENKELMQECIAQNNAEALSYVGALEGNAQYLEKALALGEESAKLPLAKLYFAREEYRKATPLLDTIENGEAYYLVGVGYRDGLGRTQSYRRAALAFEYSAEKDCKEGLTAYGKCLDTGFGMKINHEKAFECFKKSTELGDTEGLFCLAMHYLSGVGTKKDEMLAARYFRATADKGHAEGAYRYALCLREGTGVKKNDKMSMSFLVRSAKAGYAEAQYELANILFAREEEKNNALFWYERAYEGGVKDALWMVAECYRLGIGTKTDPQRAEKLYEKGVSFLSADRLFEVYGYYKDGSLPENKKKQSYFLLHAAQKGHAEAQYLVGVSYRDGSRGCVSMGDALFWLRKAVDGGYAEATYELAVCYESGEFVNLNPKIAFELYLSLAEKKYRQAHYQLARCYANGLGVKKNEGIAYEHYKIAALLGKKEAQAELARCYEHGVGTEKDLEAAAYYYELAAKQGDAESAYRAYVCSPERKEKYLLQAVDAGIPDALCTYGQLLTSDKAIAYYKRAAMLSHAEAAYLLATCYLNGKGTEVNEEEAVFWLKKATELGVGAAEIQLAECLMNGIGVEQNLKRAAYHYEMQADRGNAFAELKTGDNYRFGIGVKVNYRRAYEWYLKSAQQSVAEAEYKVSMCLFDGMGCDADRAEAFFWLKKAFAHLYGNAEMGMKIDALANERPDELLCSIGDAFYYGKGAPVDYPKAAYWYRRASDCRSALAFYKLGRMFLFGVGMPKDEQEAFYCFSHGAELGNIDAMYETAVCYFDGRGVGTDKESACKWFSAFNEKNALTMHQKFDRKYNCTATLNEQFLCAVNDENTESYYILASRFRTAFGLKRNDERAAYWYAKASDCGNADASYFLARLTESGNGVERDERQAEKLYRLSAEGGNARALALKRAEAQETKEAI